MKLQDLSAILFVFIMALLSVAAIATASAADLTGNQQLRAESAGFDALAHQVFGACDHLTQEGADPSAPASRVANAS